METDGKDKSGEVKARESLAALLNDKSNNPFGVSTRKDFDRKLLHMTLEEKGMLCNKVDVRPIANGHVHVMDQRLRDAFDAFIANQPIFLDGKRSGPVEKKVNYLNPPQSLKDLLNG